MINLDLKDRKILYELDCNCRQSSSVIGKKVGLSKQVVDYRIKKLVTDKVITRFATVVDTYKLGLQKYKLYLSLEHADIRIINEILEFLKKERRTEWIGRCSGKWDIISGYIVKDIYEFNNAVKELENKFSKYIAAKETTITLGVPHWKKSYLLDKKDSNAIIQGGFKGNYKLDYLDEEIIKILVNNAKMNITEIANILKSTPRIVKYRIKNLKKNRIILANRIFINLSKFNWLYCKAFIRFRNMDYKKYSKFFEYCSKIQNLTYLINNIGPWDLELDFEIENFNKFHEIMLDIRDKFSEIIKNYDFVIIMNEEKLDYYPGAYGKIMKN